MGPPNIELSSIPREEVDCVVIGAGVVGIAVARELALRGKRVSVLESSPTFGTGASSRNSQVVHAGIYYPPTSLKALFCVRGREMMQKYCSENGVPIKPIGKLVVATRESEIPKLNELLIRGIENGVQGLQMLDGSEAMRMEPELRCIRALYSPLSAIVDTHSLMLSLLGDAQKHGATISYNTTVVGGHIQGNQLQLYVITTRNTETLNENGESINLQPELVLVPKIVINSAGLAAIPLARQFTGLDSGAIPLPAAKYVRGSYFTLSKNETPFRHLIYPVPEEGGLGIHVTLDVNGQVRFGPDVEWIDGLDGIPSFLNKFDYSVSIDRAREFYTHIRKYYPSLKDGSLEPGYTGIRPKLSGPGEPPADFVIEGEDVHGVQGLVNLFGIDSPGLSSCLAIAEHVASNLLLP